METRERGGGRPEPRGCSPPALTPLEPGCWRAPHLRLPCHFTSLGTRLWEDRSELSRCSLYPHNQRVLTTPETTPWKRQPHSEQVTGRAAKPAKGESAESLRPRRS